MSRESTLNAMENFRRNQHEGPHKPLLVPLALSRWVRFGARVFPYEEIHEELEDLIEQFRMPVPAPIKVSVPFWRLGNDGIWRVETPEGQDVQYAGDVPSHSELIAQHAWGRFWGGVACDLESMPTLAFEAVGRVTCHYFEPAQHKVLLQQLWREE